jgi:hypothetical protein
MMVKDKRDYWAFGLVHRSVFYRRIENTKFRKLDMFPSSGEVTGDYYTVGTD